MRTLRLREAEGFALTSGTVTQDGQLEPDSVPRAMFFLWGHPCTVPWREGRWLEAVGAQGQSSKWILEWERREPLDGPIRAARWKPEGGRPAPSGQAWGPERTELRYRLWTLTPTMF